MATSTQKDDAPAKVTSRQRRIEEQRAKIETMRKAQRHTRMVWGLGILVAVLVIAAVVFFLMSQAGPTVPAQGVQRANEGATHVDQGTPLSFRSRPPTSGNHYPNPAGYQFYERAVDPGNWVHSLEHGAIVILYRPDLCQAECVAQLKTAYASLPRSSRWNVVKAIVTPYQDMDHAIAVTAWTWVDEMDAVDGPRIRAFYNEHVDRGPEQVP